ncbi:MAG TPA: Uma2 family endonuclease [Longimicrobium sp.]|nr:Uma2 family endonuclease [Longimicrobium sp.]
MAVQFAQPYRFSEQQLARMTEAGIIPRAGTELVDGVPCRAGAPVRFSSDEYFRLGEIGVLAENEHVELMDGEIIAMSPEGGRHFACVARLMRLLYGRVPGAAVLSHGTLFLPEEYRPMPDVMILRPSADDYENVRPTHEDAVVVTEVSESTLAFDRHHKAARYADAAIPEYWLVDLTRDTISVHENPVAGQYTGVRVFRPGEVWKAARLGGIEIAVDDVLKPKRET